MMRAISFAWKGSAYASGRDGTNEFNVVSTNDAAADRWHSACGRNDGHEISLWV